MFVFLYEPEESSSLSSSIVYQDGSTASKRSIPVPTGRSVERVENALIRKAQRQCTLYAYEKFHLGRRFPSRTQFVSNPFVAFKIALHSSAGSGGRS